MHLLLFLENKSFCRFIYYSLIEAVNSLHLKHFRGSVVRKLLYDPLCVYSISIHYFLIKLYLGLTKERGLTLYEKIIATIQTGQKQPEDMIDLLQDSDGNRFFGNRKVNRKQN